MTPARRVKAPSVRQIAADLNARKRANQDGATVILGAGASISSGIPGWADLAARVCGSFDIECAEGEEVASLAEYLSSNGMPYSQRYAIFQPYLRGKKPSRGYGHLARLVKDGFVSTIVTTNWDSLLEQALLRFIPFDQLKVLIRGELSDEAIAEYLEWHRGQPVVVKLHGDLQARQFMVGDAETRTLGKGLREKLEKLIASCSFVVGQSAEDVDVLNLLLGAPREHGTLYHVRYGETPGQIDDVLKRAGAQVVGGLHESVLVEDVLVNIGEFDDFFTQLDLAVQLQLLQTEERRKQLHKAESSILAKEKTGVGYINYSRISDLVERFTHAVQSQEPDLILFIDDPSAPGGMELKRRMGPIMRRLHMDIPIHTMNVEGQDGSRTHERAVTSDLSGLPAKGIRKVVILDAITFSGNTLNLARKAVRKQLPHASIALGVLVISQELHEAREELAKSDPSEAYFSEIITDRHEIFFPWGVTQTTSTFERVFEGATEDGQRHVTITKRPWGTIEILVNEEVSSVRFLTIEAGRKLSFQRHLCRDELYVALDDNIGLDICAEELERDSDEYDEHVKSLILEKGDYVFCPRGVWHRTKASMDRARILEVSFGLYGQDDDIERRWDDYKRVHKDGRI